jgi:hypothetical protein
MKKNLKHKQASKRYLPAFVEVDTFFPYTLKKLHERINLFGNFFLKKGKRAFPRLLFTRTLFNLFFFNFKKTKQFLTLRDFFQALWKARTPLKLVQRFIKNRARKVPVYASPIIQRKKVFHWLARSTYARGKVFSKLFFSEIFLLLKNSSTSKVIIARTNFHKQCDQNKVFIKRSRRKQRVSKVQDLAHRQHKLDLFLDKVEQTVGMRRVEFDETVKANFLKFKKLFYIYTFPQDAFFNVGYRPTLNFLRKFFTKFIRGVRFLFYVPSRRFQRIRQTPLFLLKFLKQYKNFRRNVLFSKLWRPIFLNFLYIKYKLNPK